MTGCTEGLDCSQEETTDIGIPVDKSCAGIDDGLDVVTVQFASLEKPFALATFPFATSTVCPGHSFLISDISISYPPQMGYDLCLKLFWEFHILMGFDRSFFI